MSAPEICLGPSVDVSFSLTTTSGKSRGSATASSSRLNSRLTTHGGGVNLRLFCAIVSGLGQVHFCSHDRSPRI